MHFISAFVLPGNEASKPSSENLQCASVVFDMLLKTKMCGIRASKGSRAFVTSSGEHSSQDILFLFLELLLIIVLYFLFCMCEMAYG